MGKESQPDLFAFEQRPGRELRSRRALLRIDIALQAADPAFFSAIERIGAGDRRKEKESADEKCPDPAVNESSSHRCLLIDFSKEPPQDRR